MSKAELIARYLIYLGSCEAEEGDEPAYLTQMQLHKLLYYVQGWSLAWRDGPIFDATTEAWKWGPVVRELYPRFADYGGSPILLKEGLADGSLSEEDKRLIESVWNHYKQYSPVKLMQMTHAEAPWKDAWEHRVDDHRGHEPISHEAMKRFFTQEYRRRAAAGLEPESMREAKRDFAEGRGVRLADLRRELGHAI